MIYRSKKLPVYGDFNISSSCISLDDEQYHVHTCAFGSSVICIQETVKTYTVDKLLYRIKREHRGEIIFMDMKQY